MYIDIYIYIDIFIQLREVRGAESSQNDLVTYGLQKNYILIISAEGESIQIQEGVIW